MTTALDTLSTREETDSSPQRSSSLWIAWFVALTLLAFVCVWPLAQGMVAANDDVKFIRSADYSGTFAQDVREGWLHQSNFRPLENLAALLCDERTLEARLVMVIQLLGLGVLLAAAHRIARRVLPSSRLALPLLITWLMLSPATTISIWQMDSCSQTWTAALGACIGAIAVAAIDRARRGQTIVSHVVAITLLAAIAVNIKELFYGWSAGIGTAVIIAIISLWRRERPAAIRMIALLGPIAMLPALHLLIRLRYSALATALQGATSESSEASRYQARLGMNIVTNAWVSLVGLFADGPLHLVKDIQAALPLRILPLIALLATFVLLAAAGLLAVVHREPAKGRQRRTLLLVCFGGLASICATLPMGTVSELYGFGSNIASGILIVAAMSSLWNPAQTDERRFCRAIVVAAAGALFVVGVYGVASRAYHFNITWEYARQLNRIVIDHQHSLPPIAKGEQPSRIMFERPCYVGAVHSQYVVPPILGIGLEETMEWLNRTSPDRPVIFTGEFVLGTKRPTDLVLTCDEFPLRKHW